MDNLTHTLAGLLVAELWVTLREREEPGARRVRAAYLVSALANNAPDLDFVYAGITEGRLGYLLHHRGHTHTFALALPLAALALGVYALLARGLLGPTPRREWRELALLAALGPLLHVGMDFANSYGVHPFWPFDSGWVYGDSVFIVEPLFWMATLPALLWSVQVRVGRVLVGLLLAVTALLPVASGMVARPFAIGVTLGCVLSTLLLARAHRRLRVRVSFGVSLVVLATFVAAGRVARARLGEAVRSQFPSERVDDLVLSPLPANPACWQGQVVSVTRQDEYVVRRARVSLAPGLVAAPRCGLPVTSTTAELSPPSAQSTPDVHFERELRLPRAELAALLRDNCVGRAFARYARVPFFRAQGNDQWVLGDLRYDRSSGLDFAEIVVPRSPERCPRFVPPWRPPRDDLLSGGRSGSTPESAARRAETPDTR
jgi:inner membrane protein